jgi:iron complex transport system substrate-binding protein
VSDVIRRPRGMAVLALAALVSVGATACIDSAVPGGEGSVTRTTSRIAAVDLVNPDRDADTTCQPTAELDAGAPDPQRILVADPSLLDALCALGLQDRVVATTTVDGTLPTYMGDAVHSLPTIGDVAAPDAAKAVASDPDLVLTLGDSPVTASLGDVPDAVVDPAADWKQRFVAVAAAVGRTEAGDERLQGYLDTATAIGNRAGARYTQASLVRFTADSTVVLGTDAFAARILTDVGAQRPPGQRDPEPTVLDDKNFEIADGDVAYIGFDGKEGQDHGTSVLETDRWLDMGAPSWGRTRIVDDEVWYRSGGLSAANIVLLNLRGTL